MDTTERVNARYMAGIAAVVVAGVLFAFWQNAAYNAAARANAYSPGAESPSRTLLVIGLLLVAAGIVALTVAWKRKLRLLDSASESRAAAQ